MGKVLVFGSFVVDLMARSSHLPTPGETVRGSLFKMGPGGKGFNQCVAAHKAGADVKMITKLGSDSFANIALDTMTELKMPKDYVFISETESLTRQKPSLKLKRPRLNNKKRTLGKDWQAFSFCLNS